MPQLLVSPPRIPPEQFPLNYQFQPDNNVPSQCDTTPDTVVSNADVNMCPPSNTELDARAQQQELDACAQQLVAGGATGDFVGEIARCFAKREAARIERERLLMANLNRRRMAQDVVMPDTVISNPNALVPRQCDPTPDTVVSNPNALVPMRCPPPTPGIKNWLTQRQQRRCNYLSGRQRLPYDTRCAPRLQYGLPVDGWASGLPALVGSTPILPDTVISNSEVNTGGAVPDTVISNPIEEIDEQPAENFLD